MKSSLVYLKDGLPLSDEEYMKTDESDNESPDGSENDTEYEVEKVVDKRVIEGRIQYLLKWYGYDSSQNSWEPQNIMTCDELVIDFENKYSQIYDITYGDVFGDDSYDSDDNQWDDSGIAVTDHEENSELSEDEESKTEQQFNDEEVEVEEEEEEVVEIDSEDDEIDSEVVEIDSEDEDSDEEFSREELSKILSQSMEIEFNDEDDEEFLEPNTDDDGNESDISYDFKSLPTIFDITLSDTEDEKDNSFETNVNDVTQVCKLPSPLPMAPKPKVPEVFCVDDSDDEISICGASQVTPLPLSSRPLRSKVRRRINFTPIQEVVVLSDSDEESNRNDSNNQSLETAVQNTMNNMVSQTIDHMADNGYKIEDKQQIMAFVRPVDRGCDGDDEDSDESEKELIIDLSPEKVVDIENILESGLILEDISDPIIN